MLSRVKPSACRNEGGFSKETISQTPLGATVAQSRA
jgi:hypothetical protein